jgi:hypothetical protein
MTYGALVMVLYTIGLCLLTIATVIALARHRKPLPLVLIAFGWIYSASLLVRLSKERSYDYLSEPLIRSQPMNQAAPSITDTSMTAATTDYFTDTTGTEIPPIEEDLATIRAAEHIRPGSGSVRDKLAIIRAEQARKRIAASKKE